MERRYERVRRISSRSGAFFLADAHRTKPEARVRGRPQGCRRSWCSDRWQADGRLCERHLYPPCKGWDIGCLRLSQPSCSTARVVCAEKQWDLVVKVGVELVAVLELKSQVGPSFGNNFNNRCEEALGSASDLKAAFREGAFKPSPKPWVGYLMLLEDCEASRRPVAVEEPHFPVFPEFRNASYAVRYEILVRKLVRDQLYDSAALLLSTKDAISNGSHVEPDPELSFTNLITALVGRAAAAHAKAEAR